MKNIAIIPARGGSKRIPRKNIKEFCGKPMLSYSIEAALRSELFEKVVVSTDDSEIAEISKRCGAEVPFIRPDNVADDHSPLAVVLEHALNALPNTYENVCCILATAPFIQIQDLKAAYQILQSSETVHAVVPITSFPFPIDRALKVSKAGFLQMRWPEHELTRSNDLPESFHDAAQFYWLKVKTFLSEKKIYSSQAKALIVPRWRVQDIDTVEDWERAQMIFKAMNLLSTENSSHKMKGE